MVVFEVGGRSLTEDSFRHIIETKIEKLVGFFGEEHRAKIEENIYSTNYIIADRRSIKSKDKAFKILKDFLKIWAADLVPDFMGPGHYDEEFTLAFIKKFKDWAASTPKVKDDVEYRAFWTSYLENDDAKGLGPQVRQEHFYDTRAKFNDPEYIENLQKRLDDLGSFQFSFLKAVSFSWERMQELYNNHKQGQASEYREQLKWHLNTKQIVCRQELAKVFGEDKLLDIYIEDDNLDISQTFIDYITQNPEFRTPGDELDYRYMFGQLTGEHLSLQEYETNYATQIEQLSATLREKFEKMDEEKDNGLVRGTLSKLKEYLESQDVKDVGNIMRRFLMYMKKSDNILAFHRTLETKNGKMSLIALPEDFEFSFTHETLHEVSSDKTLNVSGFDDYETTTALNEVVTEYFALKIDDRKAQSSDSRLTCSYSAAFPLMEKFLNQNLDKIKTFYINADTQSFKNYVGAENFEQLCLNIANLLDLAQKVPHLTLRVEQFLKNPSLCKNEKVLNAINNLNATLQQIENHIALNSTENLNLNIQETNQNFVGSAV